MGDVVFLADEWLNARPWDQLLALAVLGAVASVPLAVKLGNSFQRRRTERLRREFGPDYDIAVNQHGDWRKAERELKKRLDERRRRAERM